MIWHCVCIHLRLQRYIFLLTFCYIIALTFLVLLIFYVTLQKFTNVSDNKQLQIRNSTADFLIFTRQNGKVTHEIAKTFAESEFDKYRLIQDKTYRSDFDKLIEQMQ